MQLQNKQKGFMVSFSRRADQPIRTKKALPGQQWPLPAHVCTVGYSYFIDRIARGTTGH